MKAPLILALLLIGLTLPLLGATEPPPADAFLDQRVAFPPGSDSFVYLEQLQAIPPLVGRKVIFPPGLLDYLAGHEMKMSMRLGWYPGQDGKVTLREYLSQCRGVLGLDWKYDAEQNAIVFDFTWHRPPPPLEDPRAWVDLVGKTAPIPIRLQFADPKPRADPWEPAFDALLSQPENFPYAWKVRLEDFCSGFNLGASTFTFEKTRPHLLDDASGHHHLLVLHHRESLTSEGPPPCTLYYLLDAGGKWEDGGMIDTNGMAELSDFQLDPTQKQLTLKRLVRHEISSGISVTLDGSRPLFSTFGDSHWGRPSFSLDSAWERGTLTFTSHTQDTFLYRLTVEHGKLEGVLRKNGAILPPTHYEEGFQPLRHLGD